MEFGICLQSMIPVRSENSHRSEMVSQLLFGELYRVIARKDQWLRVQLAYDSYEGWIDTKQFSSLDEQEFLRLFNAETPISMDLVQLLSDETKKKIIPVLLGSSLPGITDQKLLISGNLYSFDGLISNATTLESYTSRQYRLKAKETLIDYAMMYINTPYLWGGRGPFGIDCSGFTQMVYKLKKIKLLRDASKQATQGEPLNFITEVEPGDLAFFENEEGNIVHVGLIINKEMVLHASGRVRIDRIDHQGIFNEEENRYTHNLSVIKRII